MRSVASGGLSGAPSEHSTAVDAHCKDPITVKVTLVSIANFERPRRRAPS